MAKKTVLYEFHRQNGAKFVDFAGFEMPVWFDGIKTEHQAVRQSAGVFDISHMGLLRLTGPKAQSFLQTMTCNDVEKSLAGKMVYSMMLNESGGILDDIMFGHYEGDFLVVVNASNKAKILEWMLTHVDDGVVIEDLNEAHAFIAVQGPNAMATVSPILGAEVSNLGRFGVGTVRYQDQPLIVSRTGYTGEDGVEIVVPNAVSGTLYNAILGQDVRPCGLGARDTLRLEVGLPLYGQELSEDITPLMTRYKWVVKWDKPFIGRDTLAAQKEAPQDWTTVGLQMADRTIARTGYEIEEGGRVTSGTMSPSLGVPIAMALVKPQYAEVGTTLTVNVRGKPCSGQVVALPFVQT